MSRHNKKIFPIISLVTICMVILIFLSLSKIFDSERIVETPISIPGFTSGPRVSGVPLVSVRPTIVPTPTASTVNTKTIKLTVPFTAQAPFGEWSDSRQQNGCEEASTLMAIYWTKGQSFTLQEAKDQILAIADWEQANYGGFVDTSARDTVERIFKGYFGYQKAEAVENITSQDIINELIDGNLVLVPANGQLLGNPYFVAPGPEEHMLVIIGYDFQTEEFITNDPGTRQGKDYRYDQDILYGAIRDYPTGYHEPIIGTPKTMIVVRKWSYTSI